MSRNTLSIARGVGVIGVTISLMIGATFAALGGPSASLTGNTFATASANLNIANTESPFGSSATGFNFTGLIPGIPSAPFAFAVQCTGGVAQNITFNIPTAPTSTGIVAGGFTGVHITITPVSGTHLGGPFTTTMSALIGVSPVAFDSCTGDSSAQQYTATVIIDESVLTGPSASVDPFNLVFTGTGV